MTVAGPRGEAAAPAPSRRRTLLVATLRRVVALLGVAVFVWVVRQLLRSFGSLHAAAEGIRWPLVAVAVLVTTLPLALGATTWIWVLGRLGVHVEPRAHLRVWFTSNLWKYLPGQIWMPVGRVVGSARAGVAPGTAFAATVTEQGASVYSAGVVFALGERHLPLGIALASLPVVLALLRPARALFRAILARLAPRHEVPELRPTLLLGIYAAALGNIALGIVSFAAMFAAVAPLEPAQLPLLGRAWAGAFVGGYLAFGAPAGLGVREGILLSVLGRGGVAAGTGAQVSILARFVVVAAEIVCWAAAALAARGVGRAAIADAGERGAR